MSTMDKAFVNTLAADVEKAMQIVAEHHGLEYQRKAGSYTSTSFSPKGTFSLVELNDEGVNTKSPEAKAFTRYAASYGIDPDALGKPIGTMTHGEATIVGLRPKAPKYPILVTLADGRNMAITVHAVKGRYPHKG